MRGESAGKGSSILYSAFTWELLKLSGDKRTSQWGEWSMMNAPTLLVGLGGLGSKVVDMVYDWVPELKKDSVGVHAFDTDVNDIRMMNHLQGKVTQTSTRMSVGEYLHRDPSVIIWFPENRILYEKTLEKGAGQIRACSRLAFRSVMEAGGLAGLERELDSLFPVKGDTLEHGVRVLVVSSLAGGTGSGIFLQVAMNIRDILENRFGRDRVLIRGAFLLPDILINTGKLDPTEHNQVRANAYASIKELDAITRTARGLLDPRVGVTIDLEYKPGQVDIEGRRKHAITSKQRPYDFCFLYDYENVTGENLRGVYYSYMMQVARSIYIQLISPIGDRQFSQEDNQIRDLIRQEGKNMYCGSGVSTLIYPYEQIVNYCALKWAVSGLDDSWLLLDKIYLEEMISYENDLRNGMVREKPDRGKRYVENLNALEQEENAQAFIRQIVRQVRVVGERGVLGEYKADLLLDVVNEHVRTLLDTDEDLAVLGSQCKVDEVKLNVKNKAAAEISRVEDSLFFLQKEIERKAPEYKTVVMYQALGLDNFSTGKKESRNHSLNTWMLSKDEAVHPVSVRYIFYQLAWRLEERVQELRSENRQMKEKIKKYDSVFDLADTSHIESAGERVRLALNQGFVGAVFKNQFKDFIEEYTTKSMQQLRVLQNYKQSYLLELVYTSLLKDIKGMIGEWERFFNGLVDTRNSLLNELNLVEQMLNNKNDPTMDYILAARSTMGNIWDKLRPNLITDVMPSEISEKIYLSFFSYYVDNLKGERTEQIKVETLYRENVLDYCSQELKRRFTDSLDMDAVTALREEGILNGIPFAELDTYVASRIKPLLNQARPFIPGVNRARELVYWGLNPDSIKQLNDNTKQDIFGGHEIVDQAFSQYEIICYRSHYGLQVEDFPKFAAENRTETHSQEAGSYYKAYKTLVNRLVNEGSEREVTPHLDKRWHLQAFMPDINDIEVQRDREKIDRAFILGITYDWLQVVKDQETWVYQYRDEDSSSLVLIGDRPVKGYVSELHKALGFNPGIVESVLARAEEYMEIDSNQRLETLQHRFVFGALNVKLKNNPVINNILDIVFTLPEDAQGDHSLPAVADRLLKKLLEEIENYYILVFGRHKTTAAKKDAARLIMRLWVESSIQQEADRDSKVYNSWVNSIENALHRMSPGLKWSPDEPVKTN